MIRIILCSTLLFGGTFLLSAQEPELTTQAEIVSFAQKVEKTNIAVLPFTLKGTKTLSKNLPWAVVAHDLGFTDKFVIFKKKMVDSVGFALDNVSLYVTGEYEVVGDTAIISFRLMELGVDIPMIFGREYRVAVTDIRSAAHDFSNSIVEQLLGSKGAFDSQILFVRKGVDGKNIYLADYDGKRARKLTQSGINIMPTFGKKGHYYFVSYLRGKPDIYEGSFTHSSQQIRLYSRRVEASPNYCPATKQVVYSSSRGGNMDIYIANADGTNKRQLTVSGGIDAAPSLSPNGYFIAFISDRSGTPQVYVMDKFGGNLKRITYASRYYDSPTWSPDGKQIAFTTRVDGQYRIGIAQYPSGDETVITAEEPGSHRYPSWSPDGNHIAFTRSGGGYSDIFAITVDTRRVTQLTNYGNAETVSWSE